MSSKDASLYQQRKHNLTSGKELSTSGTLSFTSNLSSLINNTSSRPAKPTSARLKPKKDDIFHVSNRNTAKRAKKDLESSNSDAAAGAFEQKHTADGETLDKQIWKRSQAKLKEKARLYAAMKRGDVEDVDERFAVDFDRKWAEKEGEEEGADGESSPSSEDDEESEEQNTQVEYTDEFGRTRTGSASTARRIARQTARAERARSQLTTDEFTARPSAPTNLIHGDAIQAGAFRPDTVIADQIEALARKRDRSATPPEASRFDSRAEVRNLGTGFFAFSHEDGEREAQMRGLEAERAETERVRSAKRRKEAEVFLEELGGELEGKGLGVRGVGDGERGGGREAEEG